MIAAQSIGEPGTQLTMRTFHIGGAAQRGAEQSSVEASHDGTVVIKNRNVVINSSDVPVVMSRNCEIVLTDDKGRERARFRVPYGARLLTDEGAAGHARPEAGGVGPVHAADHHRAQRPRGIPRPDRGRDAGRAGGRGDRPDLQGRRRLQAGGAWRRSAAAPAAQGRQGRRGPAAERHRCALLPVAGLDPVGRERRRGGGRRRAGAHPARGQQDARHHRRSAARGRAVRGAAAEGPRDHRRDRRARGIRQGLQGQAPRHREERRDRRRRPST